MAKLLALMFRWIGEGGFGSRGHTVKAAECCMLEEMQCEMQNDIAAIVRLIDAMRALKRKAIESQETIC